MAEAAVSSIQDMTITPKSQTTPGLIIMGGQGQKKRLDSPTASVRRAFAEIALLRSTRPAPGTAFISRILYCYIAAPA